MRSSLLSLLLITLMITFVATSQTLAHRMLISEMEQDYLIVEFDDGSKAMEVEVELYNEEELITSGRTDLEGRFEFDASLELTEAVAIDSYGHRASREVKKESTQAESSRLSSALLGVGILFLIGSGAKIIDAKA